MIPSDHPPPRAGKGHGQKAVSANHAHSAGQMSKVIGTRHDEMHFIIFRVVAMLERMYYFLVNHRDHVANSGYI